MTIVAKTIVYSIKVTFTETIRKKESDFFIELCWIADDEDYDQ